MGNIFSAFRLKKTTVEELQTLKRAFELSYAQPLSNDFFMEKVMACVIEQDTRVRRTFFELKDVMNHAASDASIDND